MYQNLSNAQRFSHSVKLCVCDPPYYDGFPTVQDWHNMQRALDYFMRPDGVVIFFLPLDNVHIVKDAFSSKFVKDKTAIVIPRHPSRIQSRISSGRRDVHDFAFVWYRRGQYRSSRSKKTRQSKAKRPGIEEEEEEKEEEG